jgi:alkylation response protein AidB-like acyl-CoA dehydrogenase
MTFAVRIEQLADAIRTRAMRDSDPYVLNGYDTFIVNDGQAGLCLVCANQSQRLVISRQLLDEHVAV